jgi:hypothetical protein
VPVSGFRKHRLYIQSMGLMANECWHSYPPNWSLC